MLNSQNPNFNRNGPLVFLTLEINRFSENLIKIPNGYQESFRRMLFPPWVSHPWFGVSPSPSLVLGVHSQTLGEEPQERKPAESCSHGKSSGQLHNQELSGPKWQRWSGWEILKKSVLSSMLNFWGRKIFRIWL